MSRLLLFFAILNVFSPSVEARKRYAVVVGVQSYRAGQPLPELPYTENDATELAETLETGGYQVTLMTQSVGRQKGNELLNPISDFIRDQIDAVLDNPFLEDDDVVIVALAGHGVQYESTEDGRKTPHFYFCPGDADIRKLNSADEITDRNRLIDLQELYASLQNCKAGGKLLLVDACRNDPTKPSVTRSLASQTLPPLPPPPGGIAAFFSCSQHQKAFEDADLKHGVFFYHVIQALKGNADTSTTDQPADGQITLTEMKLYVSRKTYDFVVKKYQGAKQAPELMSKLRVEVPLIRLKTANSPEMEGNISAKSAPLKMEPAKAGNHPPSITNHLGMEFRLVSPATFLMGSPETEQGRHNNEGPQHRVEITRPFYIGTTEVTQKQWTQVMGTAPWKKEENVIEGEDYPASYISYEQAQIFTRKLMEACPAERTYRLPTEAEFELALRAGSNDSFHFGENGLKANEFSWWGASFDGNCEEEQYAHPVAQKKPNAMGLYDMAGNVSEWCQDFYDSNYYRLSTARDPKGPEEGYYRVLRGGSWRDQRSNLRSSYRSSSHPQNAASTTGFRIVFTPE